MRYRLSESSMVALEEKSRPVQSLINKNVLICVRNDGQGMNIIEASEHGTIDTPIHKDMIPILKEAIEIFEFLADGVSFEEYRTYPGKFVKVG